MNVFSEHNSEGWWDFSQGIDPKPKAVWRERFFGVNLRRLERLFAQYRSKAEGRLAGIFFRGKSPEGWRDFLLSIDPKPKAVWSCTFSGYRSGSLERFFEKD